MFENVDFYYAVIYCDFASAGININIKIMIIWWLKLVMMYSSWTQGVYKKTLKNLQGVS